MKWTQVKVTTTNEAIEALSEIINDCGVGGVQIEDDIDLKNFLENNYLNWDYVDEELANKKESDTIITFYVSQNEYGKNMLDEVLEKLENLKKEDFGLDFGTLDLFYNNLDDEEFLNSWKKYYRPFKMGERIVVCPSWETYELKENEIMFKIDPGSAFGTGLHQTTKLCTQFLEKYVDNNTNLFDIGTGSGILSIIALLLGAKSALAVDIDKNAVDVAIRNASDNNVENFIGLYGDIINDEKLRETIYEKKYEVITANIVADVIIMMKDVAFDLLKDDGHFITSGIIKDRKDDVVKALEEKGFIMKEMLEMDEWLSIVFVKR